MTVEEVVRHIRSELAAHVDEGFRKGVNGFFQEPVNAWGVRSPDVKAIVRDTAKAVKTWPQTERERLSVKLWESGRLEEQGVAIWMLRRFQKLFAKREFKVFETWLNRYVNTWATCDGLSGWLIAAAISNEPELIPCLRAWTRSKNRWKRRASIVALLQEAKRGRHTDAIFSVADRLLADSDDMVQKGVGWVLKETYPARPRETIAFLRSRAGRAPRLVLRLAAEKMSAADRSTILAR